MSKMADSKHASHHYAILFLLESKPLDHQSWSDNSLTFERQFSFWENKLSANRLLSARQQPNPQSQLSRKAIPNFYRHSLKPCTALHTILGTGKEQRSV